MVTDIASKIDLFRYKVLVPQAAGDDIPDPWRPLGDPDPDPLAVNPLKMADTYRTHRPVPWNP